MKKTPFEQLEVHIEKQFVKDLEPFYFGLWKGRKKEVPYVQFYLTHERVRWAKKLNEEVLSKDFTLDEILDNLWENAQYFEQREALLLYLESKIKKLRKVHTT